MKDGLALVLVLAMSPTGRMVNAQQATPQASSLRRHYIEGAVSHYIMTGNNDGWQYAIHATDRVMRDARGRYYEEIAWSDLDSNAHQALTPASTQLRQTVSLDDPASYMKMPDLASVQPLLVGPITDTLTIYADLLLALQANLTQPGQSTYISRATPNSWADGQRVLVGQDAVDFSIKIEATDPGEHTETLLVKHVPPPALHVLLPAKWMQGQSAPPNFVQVSREGEGFNAETGKETFDVRLVVDSRDGHIISAALHNPVALKTRACKDRELTQCGPETSKATLREITWKLLP